MAKKDGVVVGRNDVDWDEDDAIVDRPDAATHDKDDVRVGRADVIQGQDDAQVGRGGATTVKDDIAVVQDDGVYD